MNQQQQQQAHIGRVDNDEQYDSSDISDYSSEDEDAVLLTDKVEEKLLETVARIRNKDPSIYKTVNPIFKDEDFQQQHINNQHTSKQKTNNKKFTYKDMLKQGVNQDQQSSQNYSNEQQQLPPAMQEKQAKNRFKQALKKQKNVLEQEGGDEGDDELFTVKGKLGKGGKVGVNGGNSGRQQQQEDKISEFMSKMRPQSKKLIKSVWQHPQKMDQTDVFLRDYIVNKKWLSKHISAGNNNNVQKPSIGDQFQQIDQEDEQRSVQMDEHQAIYNFRYQQPDGNKIMQYPRKIQQSMRIKPQSRKDKRKKVQERKKQEEKVIREQAERKKEELRVRILDKLNQQQQQDGMMDVQQQQMNQQQNQEDQDSNLQHDWFFCDDCGKAFHQYDTNYQCQQCQDYMLCEQCFDLIIHKHPLYKSTIPVGHGAPRQSISGKILSQLQPCKTCRRRLPQTLKHYVYEDRARNVQLLCDKCYDESPLDVKKKFTAVQPKINHQNISQFLQKDPEKIKQLTNSKQIEQMVDEYLKYEFEDVIGGGVKTKFKYITVKSQDFGLSDQQILFGDDKQLNKYVSIKALAPYRQRKMKLRNNIYKKKITTINKTVTQNKSLIEADNIQRKIKRTRLIDKLKRRTEVMKKRREGKMKILNLSNPQKEKNVFVPTSRLASYGVTVENKQQTQTQPNQLKLHQSTLVKSTTTKSNLKQNKYKSNTYKN